jgi:hypothetical protein
MPADGPASSPDGCSAITGWVNAGAQNN